MYRVVRYVNKWLATKTDENMEAMEENFELIESGDVVIVGLELADIADTLGLSVEDFELV